MSFFGQANNTTPNQGTSAFGGFGAANANSTPGFGQSATPSTGFGQANHAPTSGGFAGFGSTGGFGSSTTSNNSLFGQQNKPAFGQSNSTPGLFGNTANSNPASTGVFGNFGANTAANNNASSGGVFGSMANKPAFGSTTTGTSGGIFGSAGTNANTSSPSSGFGAMNNQVTSGFGASALGQTNAICEGTGNTPFNPFTEKEASTNVTNHFQSINFLAPYKNFSFEELRLADYNQGRRFANASGAPSAFGSTNFGGFGQTQPVSGAGFGQPASAPSGGLFAGNSSASNNAFGGTQNTGFGATNNANNTSGGLFGAKPGGLFGSNTSAQSSTGGALFGSTNNNTAGGFGANNNTGTFGAGSGGLFGASNNTNQQQQQQQQQNKPFSFAAPASASSGFGSGGGGAFGGANNQSNQSSGGNLFGQNTQTNTGLFGQQTSNQSTNPFGGFGQQNTNQQQNQPAASNPFGGFGQQNQEQKPGGLFGTPANDNKPAGGLFGAPAGAPATGSLFGAANPNATNPNAGNSLFGQKPAASGSLFGQTNSGNNTNATGSNLFGGFGNNNNTSTPQNQSGQTQSGGLFGSSANNQAKPGGLFGGSSFNNTAGGAFGNNPNTAGQTAPQASGGGLFGVNNSASQPNQAQSAPGGLFGSTGNTNAGSSLFGNSSIQQQSNPQNQFQPAQSLHASFMDSNAFGSPSIFSGLPPPPQVSGPIATPISQKLKQQKAAPLPYYKMTPNNASRFQTPTKPAGFGFSYSTYGTPNATQTSSPHLMGSRTLNTVYGRGLGKSLSTSNLRGNPGDNEGILSPGAFSAGSSRYGGTGNMKRLTIDRSLRTDLFGGRNGPPALPDAERDQQQQQQSSILKKKVSFEANNNGGRSGSEQRSIPKSVSSMVLGSNESMSDKTNGQPPSSFETMASQPKSSLPNVSASGATRDHVNGAELSVVHEDAVQHQKSPVTSSIKSSSPRTQEDQIAGEYWVKPSKAEILKMPKEKRKRVPHVCVGRVGCGKVEFNEPVDMSNLNLDELFEATVLIELRSLTVYPEQAKKPPMGKGLNVPATIHLENSWPRTRDKITPSYEKSGPRFQKHIDRLRKVSGTEFVAYEKDTGIWVFRVPHFTTYGFDYDDEDMQDDEDGEHDHDASSRLKYVMPGAFLNTPQKRTHSGQHSSPETKQMTMSKRAFQIDANDDPFSSESVPTTNAHNSFLDSRLALSSGKNEDEPSKVPVDLVLADARSGSVDGKGGRDHYDDAYDHEMNNDSEDEVQSIGSVIKDLATDPSDDEITSTGGLHVPPPKPLTVTGDWVKDLHRHTREARKQINAVNTASRKTRVASTALDGRTRPPPRGDDRLITTHSDLMHELFGSQSSAVKSDGVHNKTDEDMKTKKTDTPTTDLDTWREITRNYRDEYQGLLKAEKSSAGETIDKQLGLASFTIKDQSPKVVNTAPLPIESLVTMTSSRFEDREENQTWQLADILFGDPAKSSESAQSPASNDLNEWRKDHLTIYWGNLLRERARAKAEASSDPEEQCVAYLTANMVTEACEALQHGKDFRLAILVARIGREQTVQRTMATQIEVWKNSNMLSEMSDCIRTVYSLLAGQPCFVHGKPQAHSEDRVAEFGISRRFNLDWQQAFGLRLFYSITSEEPLEAAIGQFAKDLETEPECSDPNNHLYWTMLKAFAASKHAVNAPSLRESLLPLSPVDVSSRPHLRLAFQLYHILAIGSGDCKDDALADDLAKLYAIALENESRHLLAFFPLLHISRGKERASWIEALLYSQQSLMRGCEPNDQAWTELNARYTIPESWLWRAKAHVIGGSKGDRVLEVEYLLLAQAWGEAHKLFIDIVGPNLIIAADWHNLRHTLAKLDAGRIQMDDWSIGGALYHEYLDIITSFESTADQDKSSDLRDRLERNDRKDKLLASLSTKLLAARKQAERSSTVFSTPEDQHDSSQGLSIQFRQLAAIHEMCTTVDQYMELVSLRNQELSNAIHQDHKNQHQHQHQPHHHHHQQKRQSTRPASSTVAHLVAPDETLSSLLDLSTAYQQSAVVH